MGGQAPEGLLDIHMNLLWPPGDTGDTEDEGVTLAALATFKAEGFGYILAQLTRPQTIGYALLESPVALAGWMLDPRHGQLLQDLRCLRRRPAHRQPHPRQRSRRHHAVLADGNWGFGGAGVLGARTSHSSGRRPRWAGGLAAGRLHHLPRRDLPRPHSWVATAYPNLTYFNEADRGVSTATET